MHYATLELKKERLIYRYSLYNYNCSKCSLEFLLLMTTFRSVLFINFSFISIIHFNLLQ